MSSSAWRVRVLRVALVWCAVRVDFEEVVSHALSRLSLRDGEEVEHGVVRHIRRVRVTVLVDSPLTAHSSAVKGRRVRLGLLRQCAVAGECERRVELAVWCDAATDYLVMSAWPVPMCLL